MHPLRRAAASSLFLLTTLLGGCVVLTGPQPDVNPALLAPEAASGYTEKPGWYAQSFMVSAANPLAVDAGYDMLKQGGSAVDAAIATQMVLGLVEPQSSGLGGGALILHFDGARLTTFDGRETAPASATETLFQDATGKPVPYFDGLVGGRAVGVPGVLRTLERAHAQHGRLPWRTLFEPAIRLAENGYLVSPRLARLLREDRFLKKDPVAAAYFYDAAGQAWPVGHLLKNPALADAMRQIAERGADAFYRGPIAQEIVDKVRQHPTNPGLLSTADLADYRPKQRDALCTSYRVWRICGMPPPSSGGLAVAQMLGILENTDIAARPPGRDGLDPEAVHLFVEAGKLAYADRGRYVADPDFVPIPGGGLAALLDKTYLAQRAALIGSRAMARATAGRPAGLQVAWGGDASPELPSTSHISIVDRFGGAVAMTTTVESAFGSRQMVHGFLLNNQLTDFSYASRDEDGPIANRVEGGKRPRSTMAPTMVFEGESARLVLLAGSPGGGFIINYVAKLLVGVLDWNMDLQQAISLPNFGSRNGPTELERGRVSEQVAARLTEKGHQVRMDEQTSGLQAIMRIRRNGQDWWFGGADPRREGVARGD
ncbi:gamma-glutamyltransferase [Noviherbaspirillum suwonense]|uniref:Glutathione hydrolase proenzyme n=1 Tax=Noviherbaspirillum suwonense TaxID=1224511 RepID=A0ABY1Q6X7_9BURK|nr:gamma-glutamyltransferase [Noviherbaspirillum suwonense]SMP57563.1 gamma-glutamyltransferase 1 Threonine peptidase. MEROPS family T03 [Noviherbaspirillum suwonense]